MDARACIAVLALGPAGCSEVLGIHDVPKPEANDASSDAPPFTLQCSAATCNESSVCCLSVCGAAQLSFCADAAACTSSCVVTVACDRASDCPNSLVLRRLRQPRRHHPDFCAEQITAFLRA